MGRLSLIPLMMLMYPMLVMADKDEHERARLLRDAGTILPLEQVIEHARKHAQGRLIEAELKHRNGRYLYEVELLNERGELWEVLLDAATGELVKIELED